MRCHRSRHFGEVRHQAGPLEMEVRTMSAYRARIGLAGALLVSMATLARAQNSQDSSVTSAELHERAIKRQRQGAGLRMGSWQMMGMSAVSGASVSTLPA